MSSRSLVGLLVSILKRERLQTMRCFSRKNVSPDMYFKVARPRKPQKVAPALAWRDTNFDLLASQHFPFFLPGEIGPAWYDAFTTLKDLDTQFLQDMENNDNISCKVHSCPKLLRNYVGDLFPTRNFDDMPLSVITLSIKPDIRRLRHNNEMETEKLAQLFVLSAQLLCTRLRQMGYWADFVNPFSGKPYYSIAQTSHLYESDQRFPCLEFQIYEISECLIVSNEQHKSNRFFVGNLFTNAPSNKPDLKELVMKRSTNSHDIE